MTTRLSLPAAYNWQPQTVPVIAKSPLTQGLVDANTLVGSRFISVKPIGAGVDFTETISTGSGPTPGFSKFGAGRFFGNSGGTQLGYQSRTAVPAPFNASASSLKECSMMVLAATSGTMTSTTFFAGYGNSGGANPIMAVGLDGTSGHFQFFVRDSSGTSQNTSGAAVPVGGELYNFIATRSESANKTRYYVNGAIDLDTTASAIGSVSFDRAGIGILIRNSPGNGAYGTQYLVAVWNRFLQPSEAAALSANPWQIFGAPSRPIIINSSAGGAVNTNVTLSAASFAYTPASLSAKTNRLATLSGTSFTYSPNSLTQVTSRKAALSPVSYSYSVSSLSAVTGRNVTLSPTSYAYTPNSLTTQLTRKATLSPVSWSWTINDLTAVFVGKTAYTVTLSPASFSFTLSALSASVAVPDAARSKGGWDPYYYKRRNKRRSKPEEVQEFVSEVLNAPAPEEAEAAKIAALQYLAIRNTALDAEKREALSHALREINDFYRHVRDEIKRRQILEEDEDDDLLLLS